VFVQDPTAGAGRLANGSAVVPTPKLGEGEIVVFPVPCQFPLIFVVAPPAVVIFDVPTISTASELLEFTKIEQLVCREAAPFTLSAWFAVGFKT
jgi:hypothetical protein